jgi:hypothetical protein
MIAAAHLKNVYQKSGFELVAGEDEASCSNRSRAEYSRVARVGKINAADGKTADPDTSDL